MGKHQRNIEIARAYDLPKSDDHYRILIDRLWPRGVKKEELSLGQWAKELAPSNELRQWFDHDPGKWGEFRKRYLAELSKKKEDVYKLLAEAEEKPIRLIYAAKDEQHNNAVVMREYMGRLKQ